MAVSLCRCQLDISGKSIDVIPRISSSRVESEPQSVAFGKDISAVTLGTECKETSTEVFTDRSLRWTRKVTAAAAALTLITAAPTVLAVEVDVSISTPTQAGPGDRSLNIAIPIPDPGTWMFAQNGFLAPPPRGTVRSFGVTRNPLTGGCPSWHPINFEMVVPDGVRPKSFPRQGGQWPALYIIEDDSETIYSEVSQTLEPSETETIYSEVRETIEPDESETIYVEVIEPREPDVRSASILDALLRMSDTALTCFRL